MLHVANGRNRRPEYKKIKYHTIVGLDIKITRKDMDAFLRYCSKEFKSVDVDDEENAKVSSPTLFESFTGYTFFLSFFIFLALELVSGR